MSLSEKNRLELIRALSDKVVTIRYKSKSGSVNTFDVTRSPAHCDEEFEPMSTKDWKNRIQVYSFKHEHIISILIDSVDSYEYITDPVADKPSSFGYYAVCETLDITSGKVCDTRTDAIDSLLNAVRLSDFYNIDDVASYEVHMLEISKQYYGKMELHPKDFEIVIR